MIILLIYVAIFVGAFFAVQAIASRLTKAHDFTSLKTVTFGDESAVTADRAASIISVLAIFLIWGAFTGSKFSPVHAPGPFIGDTSFTYTAELPDGSRDDATVTVRVFEVGSDAGAPEVDAGDGFAKNDTDKVGAWRSKLISVDKNDDVTKKDGAKVVAINGEPIEPGGTVAIGSGEVTLSAKGTPNFKPAQGWQMEPIWLPSPEAVFGRIAEIANEGYQNSTLIEHLGYSLFRVVAGFIAGALVGIPLGYAMGLSSWFRGWFDPIVEFMRPVPPLALIPLVIIWAGIGEVGKVILLFLAALWIMTIAARSGVSGVRISKIHAAYSLGASKWQIMRYVIVPNSLPDIFTGARVAMGVCWGTVVAAELVAAEKGAGMMIMVASKFQLT
ncbi:MAG: ABC transporter permease subunit, partial [Pseudomonadota bacterium]